MIQLFPYSITSVISSFFVFLHLVIHRKHRKIRLRYQPYQSHTPTIYFIIKSRFITWDNVLFYLEDIREYSYHSPIILIGKDVPYEELFKNHYRVFGVIDTTENSSLRFIKKQIDFYLDAL